MVGLIKILLLDNQIMFNSIKTSVVVYLLQNIFTR